MLLHRNIASIAAAGFALTLGAGANAVVLHVDSNATGAGTGLAWSDAFTDLHAALDAARLDGAVTKIRVAHGVYTPDVGSGVTPGDRAAAFSLVSGVALRGGYAGVLEELPDERDPDVYTTTLSGAIGAGDPEQNSFTVVLIEGAGSGTVLDGFVITGGYADGDGGEILEGPAAEGGAIYIADAAPTIIGCRIEGNFARRGGGVFALDSFPVFTDTRITGNDAGEGAGLSIEGGAIVAENTRITNNTADFGAGALLHEASAAISNTFFTDNTARFRGGGLLVLPGGEVSFESGAFRGNRAENGGAISSDGADLRLVNSVIGANSAEHSGGAVHHRSGTLEMVNCAVAGNQSSFGGAVSARDGVSMINCTVANNAATQQNGTAFGGGYIGGGLRVNGAEVAMHNTILVANEAPVGEQAAVRETQARLDIAYSFVEGQFGGIDIDGGVVEFGAGNISETPIFAGALALGAGAGGVGDNLRLAPGSSGIDAGDSPALPADIMFDLDGAPRFRDDPDTPDTGVIGDAPAVVDLGAYEFRGGETTCTWDLTGDGMVGAADLGVLLSGWGVSFRAGDLASLLSSWGPCPEDDRFRTTDLAREH